MDPPGGTHAPPRRRGLARGLARDPSWSRCRRCAAQGVDAATETLEDLGFKVVTEEASGSLGLGFVWSQSPGGGDDACRTGSTITLTLI